MEGFFKSLISDLHGPTMSLLLNLDGAEERQKESTLLLLSQGGIVLRNYCFNCGATPLLSTCGELGKFFKASYFVARAFSQF